MMLMCLVPILAAADIILDQPASSYQKDYAPENGATVLVNPPPFIWVPPKDGLVYLLELARTEDFSGEGVLRMHDIPVSTVALPQTLEPGQWYWRYGVQAEPGKPDFENAAFSKVRSFRVPEDATAFPFPDVDASLGKVPQGHPRLFIRADEVEAYRERVRNGDLKGYAESFAKSHDKYIGVDLVPEPPYVEGKGAERGKNYSEIFRSTRPPMDRMQNFGLAYLLTGEKKYGEEAKRRILHFFSWDPEGSTQYWHNDEPAMWVMMRGIRAYDWTHDLFSEEERERVEKVMHRRAEQFYQHLLLKRRFHSNPHESHAGRTIGFLGEACLAFAHEWPEASPWLEYVLTCYWNVYPAWGREDGGWHEGPGYYTAYMSFALHFIAPLKIAAGIDLMQKPFFQNTPNYLLYTNPPYAKISPFGDGENGGSGRSRGEVMYAFSTLLQNPYARWYADATGASKSSDLLGMVLHDPALEARAPSELPQAHYFPGVGLVSLHTSLGSAAEDVHFLIHSDPYGPISHAHADQNAFTLEAFGQPLAIASGYYPWYGSDHHSKWQWESKSSNTITFNGGIGQKKRDIRSKGRIVAFEHDEHYDYVAADATEAYQGGLKRFIRHVIHIRPGIFVMFDDVLAPEPCALEWRLHAKSEMAADAENQSIRVAQGDSRMLVHFFNPAALVFEQTSDFDGVPPERGGDDQYHLIAKPSEPVEQACFFSILVPYKAGEEDALPSISPRVDADGYTVVVRDASGEHTVQFRVADSAEGAEGARRHVDAEVYRRNASGEIDRSMRNRITEIVKPGEPGGEHRVVIHLEK